jgi:hypothetical protein
MAAAAKSEFASNTEAPRVLEGERLVSELVQRVTQSLSEAAKPPTAGGRSRAKSASAAQASASHAAIERAVLGAVRDLLGRHNHLVTYFADDAQLAPVINKVVEQVPQAVHARRQALTARQIEALADVYMANDPLAAAMPDIEADNARAQARFIDTVPYYTADVLAAVAGHDSKNRSATASRWKTAKRIFSVRYKGREIYPAFQFKDQTPRPIIRQLLEALPQDMTNWQVAFWFAGVNGWLDGARPMDRLDAPQEVLEAARREGDGWVG